MINKISDFKKFLESKTNESLSNQREYAAKLDLLITTAKEMLQAFQMKEAAEVIKKSKNEEIKVALTKLNAHSIICEGVLVEIIKNHQRPDIDFKAYTEFIDSAVNDISEDYKEMHAKIKEIAVTQVDGFSTLRKTNNRTELETGTIVENVISDFIAKVKSWVSSIKNWTNSFLTRSTNKIEEIKSQLNKFQYVTETYSGRRSKYKNLIITILTTQSDLKYTELASSGNIQLGTSQDYGLDRNLRLLFQEGIVTRIREGRSFKYALNPDIEINPDTLIDLEETVEETVNDNNNLIDALEVAKELIDSAEQEKYYETLAKMKQQQVIDLLNDLGIKKIAINDKILSLSNTSASTRLSKSEYMEKMTNADIVGQSISEMAAELFEMHNRIIEVSGSVRQYGDDQNLPDGTLNAIFDYENFTVIPPVSNENKLTDFIKNIAMKVKSFINKFKMASNKIDTALAQI